MVLVDPFFDPIKPMMQLDVSCESQMPFDGKTELLPLLHVHYAVPFPLHVHLFVHPTIHSPTTIVGRCVHVLFSKDLYTGEIL